MTLKRYAVREMRRHPGRTLLTLLGIIIGVQSLVAIPLAIQSTHLAHRELFEGLMGRAALEVVPCGEGGFSPELAAELENLNPVRAAVPIIQSTAMLEGRSGMVPVIVLGIDIQRDEQARRYMLRSGAMLTQEDQVMLEIEYARSQGIDLDTTIQLLTPSGTAELKVAGLLAARGAAAVNGGAVAVMPLRTSQRLFRLEDRINCLNLVLSENADPEAAAEMISRKLPQGLTVQTPAARTAVAREILLNTERMLACLSIGGLLAGAFVILNSFLMSLNERRRELAILRSLGATRKQVTRLLFMEVTALGVLGTVLGIPLGLATAYIMTRLIAQMSDVIPQLSLTAGPFVLAGVLGPGVAMLATYIPARNAGRRSPLAELRNQPVTGRLRGTRLRRWPAYLGMALLIVFALFITAIMSDWLPDGMMVFLMPIGVALILVGCALVIPMVLSPLSRMVEILLRPVFGIEARLAVRHLRRQSKRTVLVVGVLMISLILAVGFGNAILNSLRDTRTWVNNIFVDVDYLVLPTALTGARFLPVAMPEEVADTISGIQGVRHVGKGSLFQTKAAGLNIVIMARSCRPGMDPGFRFMGESKEEILQGLRRGEVVIGTMLAQRAGLKRGDRIMIETRAGTQPFTIAGLAPCYTGGGMMALLDWDHAKPLFKMEGTQYFYVTAEPGKRVGVNERLHAFCDRNRLLLLSGEGFEREVEEMIIGVISSSWVLLALMFVIASLSIINFLTMNVLEQTRELGILRAVAMKRRQLYRMVFSEALAIAMISAVPGALMGVTLGYLMAQASYTVTGINVPYKLDVTLLVGCIVTAIAVSMMAALPPARRAGRLKIIEALKYE